MKKLIEKIKDFMLGKICPNCKEGRLGIINDDGSYECIECHYKKEK